MTSNERMDAPDETWSRRALLSGAGKAALSATAVATIVGCESIAQSDKAADPAADVAILNTALGLEHEAIGAYQLGAESGLLRPEVLPVAVLFQSHHKQHAEALTNAVTKFGGAPAGPLTLAQYAEKLKAGTLKSQTDVLSLAATLEKQAADIYLSVIPSFNDRSLAQAAGRLAADETMHWTALAAALGRDLPKDALTFGA